jgi:hypothetical protein
MKLLSWTTAVGVAVGVLITSGAIAQAPAGSTGECKDGSYSSAPSKSGACSGHRGVKEWFDAKKAPSAPSASAAATTTATAPMTPAPSPTRTAPAPAAKPAPTAMPTTAAAGGGAGKVWVNSKSKVYHCSGSKWYGMTKKGEYMTEAEAKTKGAHADHGKACA